MVGRVYYQSTRRRRTASLVTVRAARVRSRTPIRGIVEEAAYDREVEGRISGQPELSLEGDEGNVASAGGHVRVNTGSVAGNGNAVARDCRVTGTRWRRRIVGSTCSCEEGRRHTGTALRDPKTEEAIRMAQDKLRKDASSKRLQPDTLEFAQYVILFTTFSEAAASDVLVPHPPAARQIQVFGAISTQIRRRERQGVALQKITGRAAGGKTDPPRRWGCDVRIARGGISGS